MFKIVDVNGKDEIPLYTYMKVRLFRQHMRFWHNAYSSNEGIGEPAHMRRLARAFVTCIHKCFVGPLYVAEACSNTHTMDIMTQENVSMRQ